MALVETLSCEILELLKLLFHMSLVHIYPNALSPKATAEPRRIILTDTLIPIHRSIDCDVCGWSTDISVKRFFDMMQ